MAIFIKNKLRNLFDMYIIISLLHPNRLKTSHAIMAWLVIWETVLRTEEGRSSLAEAGVNGLLDAVCQDLQVEW